jgi:hypothetical protein
MSVTILLAQLDAFLALLDLPVLEELQQLLLAELDSCLMLQSLPVWLQPVHVRLAISFLK